MAGVISTRQMREEEAKQNIRRAAVLDSGYAFIVLQLKDKRKRRVSGFDDLVAIPKPGTEGLDEYEYKIISRQISFEPDPSRGGLLTAYVLDTEFNRKMLASHMNLGYWRITSVISGGGSKTITLNSIITDLEKLREELANVQPTPKPLPKLDPIPEEELSDEQIEEEYKRLLKLKKSRKMKKINQKKRTEKGGEAEDQKEDDSNDESQSHGSYVEDSIEEKVHEDSIDQPTEDDRPDSALLGDKSPVGMVQP